MKLVSSLIIIFLLFTNCQDSSGEQNMISDSLDDKSSQSFGDEPNVDNRKSKDKKSDDNSSIEEN